MVVYAGIDEAGYGPLLGPLAVARAVFALHAPSEAGAVELPCLWTLLERGVCRRVAEAGQRVAVNDSKVLYTPALGLKHLERGTLALLALLHPPPTSLAQLLQSLALDEASRLPVQPWYQAEGGGPELPVAVEAEAVEAGRALAAAAAAERGVTLAGLSAAVVFEDRFNRLVAQSGSKGACSWKFVAAHLRALWDRYGREELRVAVDRQGGRRLYGELLERAFPEARVERAAEGPRLSVYRVAGEGRAMEVRVQVDGEAAHLPVALASMTAKYLRELFMIRFQGFWKLRAPAVRPTFGYFGDGRRFLRELSPTLARLGIPPESLARRC